MSKRDEMRGAIQRRALDAIRLFSASMGDRAAAEIIRANAYSLSRQVAEQCCGEYEFLELSDIMEWRRVRIRR